jgi:large subunit ribosomal protein L15
MPLVRRVPKRGFTNIFRTVYAVVNVGELAGLEGPVTPDTLAERGLVHRGRPVKVLADGEVGAALHVAAHKFSAAARRKIEAAGGTCEELSQTG